jgi:hypothetical protein
MTPSDYSRNMTQTRNHMGCSYLHQTGGEAVRDWPYVLASIDLVALPAELQAELLYLRLKCAGADDSARDS